MTLVANVVDMKVRIFNIQVYMWPISCPNKTNNHIGMWLPLYLSAYYNGVIHHWNRFVKDHFIYAIDLLLHYRVQLTILHHNENCQRPVKLRKDGKPMRRIQRSKATKQIPTVQYVRENPTYGQFYQWGDGEVHWLYVYSVSNKK